MNGYARQAASSHDNCGILEDSLEFCRTNPGPEAVAEVVRLSVMTRCRDEMVKVDRQKTADASQ